MTPFLLQVAQHVYSLMKQNDGRVTVVLPSRRAAVFMRRHLASLVQRTVWAPDVMPVEDFVFRSTGFSKADPTELLFELYAIHCDLEKKNARSVDDFFPVGEMILSDFEEVDQHLVDAAVLFDFLHEARAIDLWNPEGSGLTEVQQRYLAFYASLSEYYNILRERMVSKGRIWQGLATRFFQELSAAALPGLMENKLVMAGFNAFTPAEEALAGRLVGELKAEIMWDTDAWYLDREEQEAGLFLRRYRSKGFPSPVKEIGNHFAADRKSIHMIGVPLHVAQAKEAGRILSEAPFTLNPDWQSHTAVIPADESLLLPLLNSIPPSAGKYNVTMGIPLRMTPAGSLAVLWLDMLANPRPGSEPSQSFYYLSDFRRVAGHPLMVASVAGLDVKVEQLESAGRLFVAGSEIISLLGLDNGDKTNGDFFSEPLPALDLMIAVTERIIVNDNGGRQENPFMEISAGALLDVLRQVRRYLSGFPSGTTLTTLRRLITQLSASVKIPFEGEPFTGIQVMGMLETRALDFENLIVMGMNDDIIPGSGQTPSFIPGDIRTGTFGMAGFREKTAVTAYHFYRLLQRAKNVYLIYNNIPGHLGKGDPSRFLQQIRYEFPKFLPNIEITDGVRAGFPPVNTAKPVVVEKTEAVMQKLREAALKGFSPTSLSMLVECPLRFYMSRIEGVYEPREAQISIESDRFGDVVHYAAESLYRPLLNKQLANSDFSAGRGQIAGLLNEWFEHHLPDLDRTSGNNLLVFNVAVDYLLHFLTKEREMAASQAIVPQQIEAVIDRRFVVKVNDREETVLFSGRADRIDLRDGVPVVIDYKTGTVDPRSVTIAEMELIVSQPKHAKALQLMTYAWMTAGASWFNPPFRCAIWPMRAPSKALIYLGFTDDLPGGGRNQQSETLITRQHLDAFENALSALISDLFDPSIPFVQTEEQDNCRFCPFTEMCNRIRPGR